MNPFKLRVRGWTAGCRYIVWAAIMAGMGLPLQAEPWTFAVMGDNRGPDESPGVNTQIVSRIALDIANNTCQFVLVSGDMIWGGFGDIRAQYNAWKNAMAPVYQAGIPIYPVRGNHECVQDPTGTVWRTVFPNLPTNGPAGEVGLTYSFAFSNVFCVGLDEYVRRHRINQTWLDAQLKSNTRAHVFIFGHEPAFRVYHTDCLASYAAERDIFWHSLQRAGGQVYFCGHDHFYNRAVVVEGAKPPMFQIVTGSGGAPLYPWKGSYFDARVRLQYANTTLFGYGVVTVAERAIMVDWKALLPDGRWQVLDSITIMKPIRGTTTPPPSP